MTLHEAPKMTDVTLQVPENCKYIVALPVAQPLTTPKDEEGWREPKDLDGNISQYVRIFERQDDGNYKCLADVEQMQFNFTANKPKPAVRIVKGG